MNTIRRPEDADPDRRQLLGTAATGIAVAGAASPLPSQSNAAPAGRAAFETLDITPGGGGQQQSPEGYR